MIGGRDRKAQQFGQRGCTGVMHGRAHGHLDGLQIQAPCPFPILKDHTQQLSYFVLDLPLDRFGRFFSWGNDVASGSEGRIRQICALTPINSL